MLNENAQSWASHPQFQNLNQSISTENTMVLAEKQMHKATKPAMKHDGNIVKNDIFILSWIFDTGAKNTYQRKGRDFVDPGYTHTGEWN